MKDIAEQVGVSVATVSRVLNGRPDVSKETRELVLQAVRGRGLAPGGARGSRRIGGTRTGLIGVTVPVVQYEDYGQILGGISGASTAPLA